MLSLKFDPSKLGYIERRLEKERERREKIKRLESSLIEFYKAAWSVFDPAPYVHGRHLEAIAEHLEAVSYGWIRKLLINIPPRHSKSLLTSVAWPAWIWAQEPDAEFPLLGPQCSFMCLSYADNLSLDHALLMRRFVQSPWYRERWGHRVQITSDQEAKSKFDTTAGGTRISTSFAGSVTGRGGSIKIIDDPEKADEGEADRLSVVRKYDGVLKSRVTDPKIAAEVIIMQRISETDLSDHVLNDPEFVHLCLPAEYETGRHCVTVVLPDREEPWQDWRSEEGEALWPERFGAAELARFKINPFEWASQWQQRPRARGGEIFKNEYWNYLEGAEFPLCEYIVASLDPAYTKESENDPSGFTVWGVFRDDKRLPKSDDGLPRVVLLYAFRKWLPIKGPSARKRGEPLAEWKRRGSADWGLVEWVMWACEKYKVNALLIEAKASGISVSQEISNLITGRPYHVELVKPKGDKLARAHRVVHIFAEGKVFRLVPEQEPGKPVQVWDWSDMVEDEMASFRGNPPPRYDDLTDSTVYALSYLRELGLLERREERQHRDEQASDYGTARPLKPLYEL